MREGGGKRVTAKAGPPLLRYVKIVKPTDAKGLAILWHFLTCQNLQTTSAEEIEEIEAALLQCLHRCSWASGRLCEKIFNASCRPSWLVRPWQVNPFLGDRLCQKEHGTTMNTFSILPSGLFIFILCGFDGLLTLLTVLSLLVTVSSCYSSYSS